MDPITAMQEALKDSVDHYRTMYYMDLLYMGYSPKQILEAFYV